MLRERKGNMYSWITHSWNPVKGECSHACSYCYMRRFGKQKPPRLDEREMRQAWDGMAGTVFVGSSIDMFAADIPAEWIYRVLEACRTAPEEVSFLFQSKNPGRFMEFHGLYPKAAIIGTTIETNRHFPQMGHTTQTQKRAEAMAALEDVRRIVTIEPIMDFDLDPMLGIIETARPQWINIGADSGKTNLPEPGPGKTKRLIEALGFNFNVVEKRNLKRLLNQ